MNIFPQKEHSTTRYNQNDKFCFPPTGNYALFEPFVNQRSISFETSCLNHDDSRDLLQGETPFLRPGHEDGINNA